MTFLTDCVLQDTGFAMAFIKEFGLEVPITVQRPAKAGEDLQLICASADLAPPQVTFQEKEPLPDTKYLQSEE